MGWLGTWGRRIGYLAGRSRRDELLRQEIAAHREMMRDPRRFGNAQLVREDADAVWGWRRLDDIARDVRVGVRSLVRAPGFTAVAVLSLALASGATAALFSVVNTVLLQPLPFAAADRLVQVRAIHPMGTAGAVAFGDLQAFRAESTSFERFTGYEITTRVVRAESGPERLTGVVSDRDFFDALGVSALAGRTYTRGDPAAVIVISDGLWQRMFARDPSIVGRSITLTGRRWDPAQRRSVVQEQAATIVGVMPAWFQFPFSASSTFPGALPESRTDFWIPDDRSGGGRLGNVTGRLKPGVTPAAAQAELAAIERRLDVTAPRPNRAIGVELTPLADDVRRPVRGSLWLLFGAVIIVLLGACANVANVSLARTLGRIPEIATRAALGAAPSRLARQFLIESVIVTAAGAVAGIAVAQWGLGLLTSAGAMMIPRAHEIRLDWWTFAFLVAIGAATAFATGLAPALIAARVDAQRGLRESGRTTVSGRVGWLRDCLVITEVALAFLLALAVAGVFRELGRLGRVDPGMRTDSVMTFHLTPSVADGAYSAIEARVAALPGVRAAGLTQILPLQNWGWIGDFHVQGRPESERPKAELRSVTPGYFAALGIPVRGRALTDADATAQPPRLLVNETLARLHFNGDDPIGRELDRGLIVGVVGDVRQSGLGQPVAAELYGALTPTAGVAADIGVTLLVSTKGDPASIVPAVRSALADVAPAVAIFNVRSMSQVVADSLWELTLYRRIVGMFALLALVLAAIGLYGVISYGVSARLREFALRLALGSEPASVARLVFAHGLRLASLGLVLGGIAAGALVPLVRRLPANIMPDAGAFVLIAGGLVAVALAAGAVPAIRVATVNPASVLKSE